MDSIIHKNAMNSRNVIDVDDFVKLSGASSRRLAFSKLYFFFKSELNTNHISHLIPYKGNYYDYIAHKEYTSLKEWADDNNKTVLDILYGVNKRDSSSRLVEYITLDRLLGFLDQNSTFSLKQNTVEELLVEVSDVLHKVRCMAHKLQTLL